MPAGGAGAAQDSARTAPPTDAAAPRSRQRVGHGDRQRTDGAGHPARFVEHGNRARLGRDTRCSRDAGFVPPFNGGNTYRYSGPRARKAVISRPAMKPPGAGACALGRARRAVAALASLVVLMKLPCCRWKSNCEPHGSRAVTSVSYRAASIAICLYVGSGFSRTDCVPRQAGGPAEAGPYLAIEERSSQT